LRLYRLRQFLHLPFPEQCCRSDRADAQRPRGDHLDADRFGKTLGFLDARLGGASRTLSR
jgi:hypothetical protein